MPHHTPLIATIVAGLVAAFALGALAQRLRLSPLVGYLLAGVIVGPFTPGYVADQKIANEFLAEDLKTVKNRIVVDYLLPMLKNVLWSIFNSAVSIALFGEDRSRGSSSNYSGSRTQRNSYDTYYQGGSGNRQGNPNRAVGRSLQNLDFEFRGDADDTLSQMYDAIRQYGQVSVGDLWDLMGVSNESTDYNYGWYNLDGAFIKGIPGGYRLMLSRPVPLR